VVQPTPATQPPGGAAEQRRQRRVGLLDGTAQHVVVDVPAHLVVAADEDEAAGASHARLLEAAKEIELSTKQQASAVEQVNSAISSVAQTTRETEVSSGQTLQTASQLNQLSRDLQRLVQPRA